MSNRPAMCSLLTALLLVGSALCAPAAAARMYQWLSPESGTVHLSGTPPYWYRSGQPGPRVRVYESGRLVDDTAIALPQGQRETLRREAFDTRAQREQLQALDGLESAAKREAAREQGPEAGAQPGADGQSSAQPPPAAAQPGGLPESLDREAIEQLKAIISAWDRRNLPSAVPEPPAPASPGREP